MPSGATLVRRPPAGDWPRQPEAQLSRADFAHLRRGVDIALDYLNSGSCDRIPGLVAKAKHWADTYFGRYQYASRGPRGLLMSFPSLYNLDVERTCLQSCCSTARFTCHRPRSTSLALPYLLPPARLPDPVAR